MTHSLLKPQFGLRCSLLARFISRNLRYPTLLGEVVFDLPQQVGVTIKQHGDACGKRIHVAEEKHLEILNLRVLANHASPHPVVGASDGRGGPGAVQAVSLPRRVFRDLASAVNDLADNWIGDALGVAALFGGLGAFLWIAEFLAWGAAQ